MNDPNAKAPGIKNLRSVRRKVVTGSRQDWVQEELLPAGRQLPLVLKPAMDEVDLIAWVRDFRQAIDSRLRSYGAILFRGFGLGSAGELEDLIAAVSGGLMGYEDRSSPRSLVSGNIYTSTDHPSDQSIALHNENSYSFTWPLKIFFFGLLPATSGGETPIADSRRVYQRLDPELRERFHRRRLMYVRNFGDGLGLPWQTAFQTEDPAAVEEFCRNADIETEWKSGGRLRTRQIRPAVARHPLGGEPVWFNQAHLFHVSGLAPEVRSELLAAFAEEDLPSNVYYGDGSPIEEPALDAIRAAYDAETIAFPWQQGDVLMLDNMLIAHGRAPFEGPRKIVVGMAEPFSLRELWAGEGG
jgi:alpha-ketoglutarate-dependent taurine dioxygenase